MSFVRFKQFGSNALRTVRQKLGRSLSLQKSLTSILHPEQEPLCKSGNFPSLGLLPLPPWKMNRATTFFLYKADRQ